MTWTYRNKACCKFFSKCGMFSWLSVRNLTHTAVRLYNWRILSFILFFVSVLRNGAWEIVHWEKVCIYIFKVTFGAEYRSNVCFISPNVYHWEELTVMTGNISSFVLYFFVFVNICLLKCTFKLLVLTSWVRQNYHLKAAFKFSEKSPE